MSDTDEERFTLEEARVELARRECSRSGHDWQVLTQRHLCDAVDRPISVVCVRCQETHAVAP